MQYLSNPESGRINLINNISTLTLNNPYRLVIDIPNASVENGTKEFKVENSSTIKNIKLSQFSKTPNIARVVLQVNNYQDLTKFKIFAKQSNIYIKYSNNIVSNALQYKFYTSNGDSDKAADNQNTYLIEYNNMLESQKAYIPFMQTKYRLSRIDQNSDGLILRGTGSISLQKVNYTQDNKKAIAILDSTTLSDQLEGKSYYIPSSKRSDKTTLSIKKLNQKKVQLILEGENLRDYRFVVSQDGQSMFISHRTYVLNTLFSSTMALVNKYSTSLTSSGYRLFDIYFNRGITYDIFELNNNLYLDIDNLQDFNQAAFERAFKGTPIQAAKIAGDKTRFTIPLKNLKFSYANIESNSKSIRLCFKDVTPNEPPITITSKETQDDPNVNITYIPKGEDTKLLKKSKKQREDMQISAMKKVVLDPGHGGSDCGAIALGGKYFEKTINLEVAQMIKEKLSKKGVYVYMTREKDETLTLEERVNYSNTINPDIYISVHANSTLQSDRYGLEVHYYKEDSLELANTVHKNFASEKNLNKWETKDRGVIKSRFYVINHTEVPSVLIEIGFISNEIERDKLNKKERKEQIADAITHGILEYLKVK
ncbi:N-acetylmuramoyl-L-alanine amidase [bacterium]|nr:N-acetylmuramoyl-L-alanine amidase [bacterium]